MFFVGKMKTHKDFHVSYLIIQCYFYHLYGSETFIIVNNLNFLSLPFSFYNTYSLMHSGVFFSRFVRYTPDTDYALCYQQVDGINDGLKVLEGLEELTTRRPACTSRPVFPTGAAGPTSRGPSNFVGGSSRSAGAVKKRPTTAPRRQGHPRTTHRKSTPMQLVVKVDVLP